MTDSTFIVFENSFNRIRWIPAMGAETLQEAIQNITEGCTGIPMPSQNLTYHIFETYRMNYPLHGTTYDVFKFQTTVAGSRVTKTTRDDRYQFLYALTHKSSMAWFFTDNLWGD
jgi:hypothetical protein